MGGTSLIIRQSAAKHGLAESGRQVATWPIVDLPLDDENPRRFLRLGFDARSRLVETVVLVHDDGKEELIHAMKCRPQYFALLP